MAITGTLVADFSSFEAACAKAETSLKGMEQAANKTGRMLNDLDKGVDLTPIVTDADAVSVALKKVSTSATDVTTAAGETDSSTQSMRASFGQFDKTLSSVGINLGPIPAALDELTAAAGSTTTQLGLLAKAGLVTAAAVGGWKIGTWINDLTGLSDKVGDFIENAEGLGLVVGKNNRVALEAAEGAATLQRAYDVTGKVFGDVGLAAMALQKAAEGSADEIEANAKELEKGAAEAAKFAEFTAKLFSRDDIGRADEYATALGGVHNISKLTVEKKQELRKVVGDALAAYDALGERAPASLQAIHAATTELIPVTQAFSATTSKMWVQFAAGIDDGKAKMAEIAASAKLSWEDLGGTSREALQQIATDAAEKYAVALEHSEHFTGKQIADFRRVAEESAAAVAAWGTDTLEAYDAIAAKSGEVADTQIANSQRAAAATVTTWGEAMDAVRAGQGTLTGTIAAGTFKTPFQQFAETGTLPAPVLHQPWWHGQPGQSGGPPVTTININGSVLSNPDEIARVVGDALVSSAKSRGVRLPAQ